MRKTLFLSFLCLFVGVTSSSANQPPQNLWITLGSGSGSSGDSAVDDNGDTTITGPTPDWNFDVPRGVSRTSGVAPLSVHFNAGLTASSPGNMPFHDYEYSWNFGDSNSGTWGTSGKSKNTDKGAVAAHVYETPGTYTATLSVRNHDGVVDAETFTITVEDPNAVYADTNTTCISSTSDFTGCPAGAKQVTTTNLGVLSDYTSAGSRVLLRRGSSWNVNSSPGFPNNQGPVHIGAFGSCSSPDELGICSNAPTVNINAGFRFIDFARKKDWRLTDITFEGTKIADSGLAIGTTDAKYHLISRVKANNLHNSISMSHWRSNDEQYDDHIALVSSKLENNVSTVAYMGSERLILLGNVIRNSDTTHVLRMWQGYQGVIGHNMISGSSLTTTAGRHALKMYGPAADEVGSYAETGGGGLRYRSQFAVISNNVIGSSGPWPISIGPKDHRSEENVSDILFEKNRAMVQFGDSGSSEVQRGLMLSGRYITARNNILDGTGSYSSYRGIGVYRRGIELTPLGNRIYNNTIYNNTSLTSTAVGVEIDSSANDTIVRNNYVSFPSTAGSKSAVSDSSGNAITDSNILTDTPHFIDPNNSTPLLRNFRISQNAEAINQGNKITVLDDIDGNTRGEQYDLGAFEF